jgi:uncharacterized protein (DUF433 family)
MNWNDRISVNPNVLVGKPVIKGTRIAVEFVIDLLGRGWTGERILREYDHLTAEDLQACLAYLGTGVPDLCARVRPRSGRPARYASGRAREAAMSLGISLIATGTRLPQGST